MPQTCPACLWISSAAALECERCGQPFDGRLPPAGAVSGPGGLGRLLANGLGLAAGALLAAAALRQLGQHWPNWNATLGGLAHGFGVWLLGPNQVFKPILVGMLVTSLVIWAILWLLARLN